MLLLGGLCSSSVAKDYLVSTPNTSLLITAVPGEKSKFQYYGSRIEERDIQGVYDSGQAFGVESYPVFGLNTPGERAMAVAHADGNMSLDLVVEEVRQYEGAGAQTTEIRMKDLVYPFILKQYLRHIRVRTSFLPGWKWRMSVKSRLRCIVSLPLFCLCRVETTG